MAESVTFFLGFVTAVTRDLRTAVPHRFRAVGRWPYDAFASSSRYTSSTATVVASQVNRRAWRADSRPICR
jgi:hypothetical protein